MDVDCDVVVIGLGPVGDVLAGLCATEGLRVIAIDRNAEPYPLPRAAVFDDEIMRIFQRLGVAERLAALCRVPDRYEFVSADGQVLLDFPVKGVPTVSGWEGSYVLHQPSVEAVLRVRLAELGVDVRLGHKFTGLDTAPDGVVISIEEAGQAYQLKTRFVVGADGASSAVREAIGVELFDYAFDEPWLVLDAQAPDEAGLPARLMQICDPRRPGTYLKMTDNRYRWEFMMLPGETPEQVTSDTFIRELLESWNVGPDFKVERRAVYRFHGLVALDWRKGRVLLAGDAAHQMPPFAGQGMCSGIRDAGNLAWKLGSVVREEASDTLLDSYQAEREPHVRAIVETAIAMGKIVCLCDPDHAAARDLEMLERRAAGNQELSMHYPDLAGGCLDGSQGAGALFPQPFVEGCRMDDVLGTDHWLIGRDLPDDLPVPAGVKVLDLETALMKPFAPAIGTWLDRQGVPAVLVRPDRHVFGTGDARRLAEQLASAIGRDLLAA